MKTNPHGTWLDISRKRLRLTWISGLVLLGMLVALVLHLGDERRFVELLYQAKPTWLLVAVVLQGGTYACAAAIWHRALVRTGCHQSLIFLMGLGVAKLFIDQVLPSAGIGGSLLVVDALQRRGVPSAATMVAILVDLVAYYVGFAALLAISLGLLWYHHDLNITILIMAGVFAVIALTIAGAIYWFSQHDKYPPPGWLRRLPILRPFFDTLVTIPTHLLRDRMLLSQLLLLNVGIFVLDAATLLVMLYTMGQPASPQSAFTSFMIASLAATVGLVPGGLGPFEGAMVAMLTLFNVPLEPALAATFLLRGFTFWLPMVPGFWFTYRTVASRSGIVSDQDPTA
jgi:uncharacterized membrane protein YbhN (UPF0104 family)